jgi:hypothetical protein
MLVRRIKNGIQEERVKDKYLANKKDTQSSVLSFGQWVIGKKLFNEAMMKILFNNC